MIEAPETLVLVNGSGRIGLGVMREAIADPELTLAAVNVKSARDPFEDVGGELISDLVYGQATPVKDARTVNLEGFQRASTFSGNIGLEITAKTGEQVTVPFSVSDRALYTDWDQVTTTTNGGQREKIQGTVAGVVDASPIKTRNFQGKDGEGNPTEIKDPKYKGRHPGHHLKNGADFVIVSSPLGLDIPLDGYPYKVPTFISGVNNDQRKIEEALERGELCISASSCSTGAIATLIAVMRHAGFEFSDHGSKITILHANTMSDDGVEGLSVRSSTSGSQSEVAKIFRQQGLDLSDSLAITCNRVPLPTGSGLVVDMALRGSLTTEEIVERMVAAVAENSLAQHFGIETRVAVDSTYIRGDRRTVVMDAAQTFAKRNAAGDTTNAHYELWFDNEGGYSTNLMRLFKQVAGSRRAMDLD